MEKYDGTARSLDLWSRSSNHSTNAHREGEPDLNEKIFCGRKVFISEKDLKEIGEEVIETLQLYSEDQHGLQKS